jgi:hypothetical protein
MRRDWRTMHSLANLSNELRLLKHIRVLRFRSADAGPPLGLTRARVVR